MTLRTSTARTAGIALAAAAFAVACGGSPDARVVGTAFTGTCDWNGDEWLGVRRLGISLEYAPRGLEDRSLPSRGNCSLDVALFADESRFDGGEDLPKLEGSPRWTATEREGSLTRTTEGLYTGSSSTQGGCAEIDEVFGDGLRLDSAGALDGVGTPSPGTPGLVRVDGELDHDWSGVVQYGNPMDLSWTATGWDESFVQIRAISSGSVMQTLTCNTTGADGFLIDNDIWDELGTTSGTAEVYVGFQNVSETRQGGDKVETITRLAHVVASD